ncbi:methylaspartate ammonia-lyase [Clostridium argentinense CDC 2741]|uniref:methylaspartate ammonia-lyase n=1 Tax=Clostridium argentinense CDC 2741 TaxID=1418104 RepID=A0A0C1R2W2_9CLOT|nr:methylaspartate ammonia-lyase [Clostridium argentinense]ARC83719.1 methylaspartate ammonia-lyase [Clostridium argentinense]KIE47867.1 methylaspartate ammonia-lyase [Clostridium argentinense CDC 2741]NFF41088.1 methylaspartate ammonia-lyase [Clostridium argentinense]NFP52010.1 methylaspartate ammonia-lyase [Clostridium argentinense]NFP73760.1 methylaspartate ammonia-lyase [Clostridium argentinense]
MKIVDVVCSAGRTGFYFDDQRAIKKGAGHDGFTYVGEPVTDGFTSVRQAGESISVMLILEDGQVALGDCAAVQYSGAGGRDPLFLAKDFIPVIEKEIAPKLIGRELDNFKSLAEEFDHMTIDGKRLHTAIRYGVTQAILDGVAKAKKITMAEVVKEEYNTGVEIKRIPIFTQSGDDRYSNADKMIIKGADVMPHALINHVEDKLGAKGEKLHAYVKWLSERVLKLRTSEDYSPIFHIDVYGTIGVAFDYDIKAMADYLATLEEAAKPFKLRIEGPMDVEHRERQMEALRDLTTELDNRGINVELVADEWCNTFDDVKFFADNKSGHMLQIKTPDLGGVNNIIEAILYCKEKGVGAYCGGTCNETNRSAEICTNIAIACGADQCLAKPGMGVDEGYMIVNNEMNRVIALINRRNK